MKGQAAAATTAFGEYASVTSGILEIFIGVVYQILDVEFDVTASGSTGTTHAVGYSLVPFLASIGNHLAVQLAIAAAQDPDIAVSFTVTSIGGGAKTDLNL